SALLGLWSCAGVPGEKCDPASFQASCDGQALTRCAALPDGEAFQVTDTCGAGSVCDAAHGACGFCGDGIVSPGEACDPRDPQGGSSCETDCTAKGCGNGVLDADRDEECDEGASNGAPGNPCDATCHLASAGVPFCGDGNQDPGEECDDGNHQNGDSC